MASTASHSPGSLYIVKGEVEVPNNVAVSCAMSDAKVEDGSQVGNAAEQHINSLCHSLPIFGEEKGRGEKSRSLSLNLC